MTVPSVNAKIAGLVRKRKPRSEPSPIVLTIGHSTRTLKEFICLLQAHGVRRLVDVRTVPRSLHNPQFKQDFFARLIEQSRARIRSHAGTRRSAPRETRFHQRGMAKCLFPWLCR